MNKIICYKMFLFLSFSACKGVVQNVLCMPTCKGETAGAGQNLCTQPYFKPIQARARGPQNEAQRMGKRLLKAQSLKDQSQFKAVLNEAVQKFSNDKNAFYEFLDARDGSGCTCLIRAATLSDINEIVFILEKLEQYFDKQDDGILDVFNVLNAQGIQGYTALYLVGQNGDREQLDLMLYHIIRLLGSEKELFLQLLNIPAYEDGWTILHWLAFQGSMVNLEALVIVAEKILGKNSEQYEAFINPESITGRTPLDNTYFNARHHQFLVQHGAVSLNSLPSEIIEARKIGLALIDSIRENKFSMMQKIMTQAQKKYKGTPHLFLEVLMARTEAGWDPLMNAVAINAINYEFTAYLLHTIETFFEDEEEEFYSIMRSVAQDGRGALIIAILQRNFKIAHLIIKTIKEYAPSKHFLYTLLNVRTYSKGFTPLLAAVNFSLDEKIFTDIIKELVDTIGDSFGKGSRAVDLFVNSYDLNGYPVMAYATSAEVIKVLKGYGAQKEKLSF